MTFLGAPQGKFSVFCTENDEFCYENNIKFSYHFTDETTLKTIIRSNPGLVKIEEGTITDKWHFNDFPSITDLTN